MLRYNLGSLIALLSLATLGIGQPNEPKKDSPDDLPAPKLLVLHDAVLLKASSGNPIREVFNENDRVLRISRLEGNNRAILVLPMDRMSGNCRLWLTDDAGRKDQYEVVVRPLAELPVGARQSLQLPSKQPLIKVYNHNEKVAAVAISVKDPTVLEVDALAPGTTAFSILDKDRNFEPYDVVVVKPNRSMKVGEGMRLKAASGKDVKGLTVSGGERIRIKWAEDAPDLNSAMPAGQAAFYANAGTNQRLTVIHTNRQQILSGELTDLFMKAVEPGLVRLVITDADGKTEALDILVTPK